MTEGVPRAPFDVRKQSQRLKAAEFFTNHYDSAISDSWSRSAVLRASILTGVGVALTAENPSELHQQIGLEMRQIKESALQSLERDTSLDSWLKAAQVGRVLAIFDGTIPHPSKISAFEKTQPRYFNDSGSKTL